MPTIDQIDQTFWNAMERRNDEDFEEYIQSLGALPIPVWDMYEEELAVARTYFELYLIWAGEHDTYEFPDLEDQIVVDLQEVTNSVLGPYPIVNADPFGHLYIEYSDEHRGYPTDDEDEEFENQMNDRGYLRYRWMLN